MRIKVHNSLWKEKKTDHKYWGIDLFLNQFHLMIGQNKDEIRPSEVYEMLCSAPYTFIWVDYPHNDIAYVEIQTNDDGTTSEAIGDFLLGFGL